MRDSIEYFEASEDTAAPLPRVLISKPTEVQDPHRLTFKLYIREGLIKRVPEDKEVATSTRYTLDNFLKSMSPREIVDVVRNETRIQIAEMCRFLENEIDVVYRVHPFVCWEAVAVQMYYLGNILED